MMANAQDYREQCLNRLIYSLNSKDSVFKVKELFYCQTQCEIVLFVRH